MQTPDAFQWQRSTLLGIAGGDLACMPQPALFVFVELTGLLAYRVPYNRPARTMPVDGEAGAALACRCPVRGTSGPRCIRAGRNYPAGLPSYQEPM